MSFLVGYRRDKAIIESIGQYRALSTDQVWALFFSKLSTGKRKAQARLQSLVGKGLVRRIRLTNEAPFYYFTESQPGQLDHLILVNWVALWIKKTTRSWESIRIFEYEKVFGNLRVDLVAIIDNHITGRARVVFVELDRAESGNRFDKVLKYNDLHENQEPLYEETWFNQVDRFPAVMFVTTTEARMQTIKELIIKQNRNKLIMERHLVTDLINMVMGKVTPPEATSELVSKGGV